MKVLKKIFSILANVCYIVISIYLLVCLPMLFGYKPLVVLSGSMEPTYKVGAIIYYESFDEIKKDDVIVFSNSDDSFVTHRVVELKDDKYVTKGDANESVDAELVEAHNIKGKAIKFNIPYLGYYVQYVNTNLWLVIAVIVVLVSEFLISNLNNDTKKDEFHED